MNDHWAWSQVNTLLDWRPVNCISDKVLIWWLLEEWRMWQIVEHPPNKDSLCKMDLTDTWTKHTSNTWITTNLAAQESIVYGQSLILNVCNSFKQEEKQNGKQKDHNLIGQFIGMFNVRNEYLIKFPQAYNNTHWMLSHHVPSQASPSWSPLFLLQIAPFK